MVVDMESLLEDITEEVSDIVSDSAFSEVCVAADEVEETVIDAISV